MKSMVVFFALCSVAYGSIWPFAAQPPHHPAVVLDPHGRPLDTAEVINARALHLQAKALEHGHGIVAHSVVAPVAHAVVAPAAVSHQSRVDVHSSPAVVAHSVVAPVLSYSAPILGHGLAGHGHYLKKRSLYAHSVPVVAAAPAVSHQSRVDVISSPAVHAVAPVVHAAPVIAHAAPLYAAPAVKYVGGSAVSHQSRVDVQSSPAVVAHSVVAAPVVAAHSAYAAPVVSAHSAYAAPVLSAHSAYAAPSLGYASPGHAGLLHSSPLAHAW